MRKNKTVLVITTNWYDSWFKQLSKLVDLKVIWFDIHLSNIHNLAYWLDWAESVVLEDGLINHPALSQMDSLSLSQFIQSHAESREQTTSQALIASCLAPSSRPVLFVASNDTHVKMFFPIAQKCSSFQFATIGGTNKREGTDRALSQFKLDAVVFSRDLLYKLRPSVVVLGNDWGVFERPVVFGARQVGVPTVCIQEGPLDFESSRLRIWNRMRHADFAFVQGWFTLGLLDRPIYFITGNPRFDHLRVIPLPPTPVVMLNVNFTYGVFESWRERWVQSAVDVIKAVGYDYFISQHPRDRGRFPDLSVMPSGAFVVHDQLRNASILVTRFSTLVYEAALMGRAVIYYNPHGEGMCTFNNDRTGGIIIARSPSDLHTALLKATTMLKADDGSRQQFLRHHCNGTDGRAAERCTSALTAIPVIYKAMSFPRRPIKQWLEFAEIRTRIALYHARQRLSSRKRIKP